MNGRTAALTAAALLAAAGVVAPLTPAGGLPLDQCWTQAADQLPPEPAPLTAPTVTTPVCQTTEDRLRQQLLRERTQARADVRAAYWRGVHAGRRQVIVRPDVQHVIRITARLAGVPEASALRVARCESRYDPRAQNGQYLGVFQFGAPLWRSTPFRDLDRRDALANAAAAAWVVRRGGWGPWECRP